MATDRVSEHGVEVDELHVDHDVTDDALSPSPGAHVQSDSMRNLLIVENAGRSTAFLVEAVVTIMLAACLLVPSLATVIVVPLMYSDAAERYPVTIDVHNCWAYGLWLPFAAVSCGILLLKAAHTGVPRYFSIFYSLCILTLLCCVAVIVLRSLYYAHDWYRPLIDRPTLHSKRQFSIQIACDALCLALFVDCATLLSVYLRLYCWQHYASNPRPRRGSSDHRNMFV